METTALTAPAPEVGSAFDVTNLDRSFREVAAIERSWRLPALPDAVKLDLISQPEVNQEGLGSFLRGIDSDFNPEPEPAPVVPRVNFRDDNFNRSGFDQFRVTAAGIAGEPAPTDPTIDAVKHFKLRAIEKGYLDAPESGEVDGTWSSELNSIRGQMLFDDQNDRLRGNRPGAVSTNTAIDILGKWTSPTGLLAAATELDLFWDFGAVGKEFTSWGDKWRKLDEASNPFDFGAKLVDALTGPLDDIVIPAANWLLLGSGVGVVANTARIGFLASRAGAGAKLVRGLYSVGNAMNVRSAANLSNLAEKSWMATKLLKSSGEGRQALGGAMAAWRAATPVRNVKAGVQLGMRAGFVSQAQDLLPGYQGGTSLADVAPLEGVNNRLEGAAMNPAFMPIELLIAPYNIFAPGTFLRQGGEGLGAVSRTASGLLAVTGTAGGRAAIGGVAGLGVGTAMGEDLGDAFAGAAIGAGTGAALPTVGRILGSNVGVPLGRTVAGAVAGGGIAYLMDPDADAMDIAKGAGVGVTLVGARSIYRKTALGGDGRGKFIGHVSDYLQHTSFAPMADNQRVTEIFHRNRTSLPPEQLETYERTFAETNSVKKALGAAMGGDDEAVGAFMTFQLVSAAIDHTAQAQASAVGTRQAYHTYRNKLTAQLQVFDLDNWSDATLVDMARARALIYSDNPNAVAREFQKAMEEFSADPGRALEFGLAHNKTAETTLQQLLSPENMPDLHKRLNLDAPDLPGGTPDIPRTDMDEGLSILDAYLPQVMPTFGNWTQFDAQTSEISQLLADGLLETAKFKPGKNRYGRKMRGVDKAEVLSDHQVTGGVLNALFTDPNTDVVKVAKNGRFAALANLSPHGRMTVARVDTPTKQDVMEVADRVKDLLDVEEALEKVTAAGVDLAAVASQLPKRLNDQQVRTLLKQAGSSPDQYKNVKRVVEFARRKGVTTAELRVQLQAMMDEVVGDSDTWSRFGLRETLQIEDEGRIFRVPSTSEALHLRYQELAEKERFTAAEIDLDDLVSAFEKTGDTEGLERIQALKAGLDKDGYKLVHGVEFLMPHDLAQSAMFADVSRRNLNAVTLGNAFKGRHPIARKMLEERRHRTAMSRRLTEKVSDPALWKDGSFPEDLSPESVVVGDILADLNQVLETFQNRSAQIVDNMHQYNWFHRRLQGVDSSLVPLRTEEVGRKRAAVVDYLEPKYGKEVAEAAWLASKEMLNDDFKDVGLYAIEAKLRMRNEFAQSLKFLSGTRYGESLAGLAAARQAAVGAGAGVVAGMAGLGDENGLGDNALIGAVAGGVSGLAGGKQLAKLIPRAEQFRYGYLADGLVQARDTLRFTLSPFFDISRYTEGYMLGQTAAPLRDSAGEKIVMPYNVSPSKLRKTIKKDLVASGKNPIEADRLARQQYDDYRTEFRNAVKGDYEPDELDQTGRWFKQVGIMGFSPTDWMTTAFVHLRNQGLAPDEAYRQARQMYTYGTNGRSAAEMSVNFIFFPFSFQKKALTHIGKWMNDDLSRSIMIHDAFKTYEILNEEYDLTNFWKEQLPVLNQLQKLNLFSFGISPGRFGGINAQFLESAGRGALNLFTPQGVSVKNAAEAAELQKLVKSVMPAYNDIDWMIQNLGEQGHVMLGGSWQTRRADISSGYQEWNDYKAQVGQQLAAQGFTWSDLYNKSYLAPQKAAYDLKRAEIASKYPAWNESRKEATGRRVSLQMERADRLARAAEDPATASVDDLMMAQFEQELEALKQNLEYQGVKVGGNEGWEDAPAEVAEYITAIGVDMLNKNPDWIRIWDKFYRSEHGMLEALV